MITRLAIENFRGLQQLVLDELRRVNLIVGGNDTGKTSVLEALVLLFGDGKGNVGAKPKAEVIAEILQAIKTRQL